ncbi:MAG: DUF1801 domain-containing protein [Bacteroidota bacterium]
MQSDAKTPDEYIANLTADRMAVMSKIRSTILENIPQGFKEEMGYGMLGYVVPHSIFPAGYHCDPKLPLPFLSLASQKNYISFYHMGLYAESNLLDWFTSEYSKTGYKLDMGKCCVRFKKMDKIPYEVLGELSKKITVNEWIEIYQKNYLR